MTENSGSGTPVEYRLKQEKADSDVNIRTKNLEDNAQKRKGFLDSFAEGIKKRALMKLRGELTPEEKARAKLELKRIPKGGLKVGRRVPIGSELRMAGGGTGQNPLIQVGRQAPNPFLVNKPFTGQAVIANSRLRQNNYPIGFRPRGYDRELMNGGFTRARNLRFR